MSNAGAKSLVVAALLLAAVTTMQCPCEQVNACHKTLFYGSLAVAAVAPIVFSP